MGKEKKAINVLTAFFISHKNDVKTIFNWILNQCSKGTRQHDPKKLNYVKNDKFLYISNIRNT